MDIRHGQPRTATLLTCYLRPLLALASTVILDSEPQGTHDHDLVSDGSGTNWLSVCWVIAAGSRQHSYFWFRVPRTNEHILLSHHSESRAILFDWLTDWLPNCCWTSPAQLFLVPSLTGLMTIFYCLTALGVGQLYLTDWLTAKFLLVLASTVILGSESHGTRDHISLSDGSGSRATLLDWLTDC
jgi:hypothetical protein